MDIIHSVTVKATPERVLETITTQEGLAGWWTPDSTAEPRVGSVNEHRFGAFGALRMRVDVLEPARVVWSAVSGCPEEWKTARITFTIRPDENGASLEFRQGEISDDYESVGEFNYLWGQYMRSLRIYAETGVGEPYGSEESKKARTTPRRG